MKKLFFTTLLLIFTPIILMGTDLEQSLAKKIAVFVYDSSTGQPKTAVAAASVTCEVVKSDMSAGSFTPTASGGNNDWVEKANGAYELELTATQLDTRGALWVGCSTSGGLSARQRFQVVALRSLEINRDGNGIDGTALTALINGLPANLWAYDTSLITTSNSIGLHVLTNVDTTVSSRLAPTVAGRTLAVSAAGGAPLDWVPTGTAQAGGNNTITFAAADAGTAKSYQNGIVVLTGGTGVGQSAIISSYDSTTKIATILFQPNNGNWQTNPTSSTTYAIIPGRR